MAANAVALGLDIGGTKLATGVVTDDGRTHGLIIEPTRKLEGPDAVIGRLLDMGRRSIEASGIGRVDAVGVSCGGPLDATRGILNAPLHLPGWIDIPITDLASEHFGVPAVLENDATAAALGEYLYGAGRGSSTMLYLTISTGIGGGAVINGTLHRGAAGNGGEFGHVLVRSGGRECLCGRRGCLEVYASGTSIAVRAAEAVRERGADSSLAALSEIRSEHVVAAAAEGDPLAREIWTETCDLLASALTDLVNVLEPDLVVLGGGVTRSGDALLGPVREAVKRDAMAPAATAARIELAQNGEEVGVVGAAAVAFDALNTPSAKESNNG